MTDAAQAPATLEQVKTALRISGDTFDGEITGVIDACKQDLKIAGVVNLDESDPLILRAVILYAKANFGYVPESEKFQRSYDLLKRSLCLAGDYNAVV